MGRDRAQLMLHEPNLYKAFIILALPVFGANFMKAFNDMVDTYFIGQMADSAAAQAGMSLSWPLINILLSFQVGFAVAGVAIISRLLGAGDEKDARDYAGNLVTVSLILGVFINIALYLLAPGVVKLMVLGATGGAYEAAVTYIQVRSFEMIFTFLFAAFQSIRQAQGDTLTPVLLSVAAVVVNIALTAWFVQGMGLGVFGAGLATVIGQAVIAPVCLVLLFHPGLSFRLTRSELKLRKVIVRPLTRLALPSAGSQALASLGFLVLQSVIYSYGDAVTAAFSVGNKISNMLLMPVLALGSVLAAFVGQNLGAGDGRRAFRCYQVSRNIAFVMAVVGSLCIYPFRAGVVNLLTNDPATQAAAMDYIFWVLLTQPLMALFQNYLGAFNGSGRTGYAFLMATARLWVIRLPLILIFKTFTDVGSAGIWYAMNLSNLLILVLGAFLLRRMDCFYEKREAAV